MVVYESINYRDIPGASSTMDGGIPLLAIARESSSPISPF